ncbi:TAXI family TRAP transporter solute-binding subunit [Salicibibacter cibarius]|uniref:TAXI family TRAP transporter solute-binding subunit n=1 Tax=Salicibibacter cibarius TaxID=2743000 RepID=A0A7T6Z0N5_9BACI|nr:TAXI family TRAP transporter solute-binding subunit [Salicibibacter cibarius]QQK74739.1 TAXI family TRAP transporter solute-binding subunit [Salicibibacter cibarius]
MKHFIIFIFIFFGSLLFTACESQEQSTEAESGESANESFQTTIAGGTAGGAWTVFTEGIAETIRSENEGSVITTEPGDIIENPLAVGIDRIPYALTYSVTADAALHGEEPYDQSYEDIRAISVVIPTQLYQFVIRANADFDSIDEIVEEQAPVRIAINDFGSPGDIATRTIFNEYGVTYDDIRSWGGSIDQLTTAQSFEYMADGRVDIAADIVPVPDSGIVEATATMDIDMLPIRQDVIDSVSEDLDVFFETLPEDTYDFLDEDIDSFNSPGLLITNKQVSEEEVYQVTKSIYENLDYLSNVHEDLASLDDENITEVGEVPLHPGAEKFYEEEGLIN